MKNISRNTEKKLKYFFRKKLFFKTAFLLTLCINEKITNADEIDLIFGNMLNKKQGTVIFRNSSYELKKDYENIINLWKCGTESNPLEIKGDFKNIIIKDSYIPETTNTIRNFYGITVKDSYVNLEEGLNISYIHENTNKAGVTQIMGFDVFKNGYLNIGKGVKYTSVIENRFQNIFNQAITIDNLFDNTGSAKKIVVGENSEFYVESKIGGSQYGIIDTNTLENTNSGTNFNSNCKKEIILDDNVKFKLKTEGHAGFPRNQQAIGIFLQAPETFLSIGNKCEISNILVSEITETNKKVTNAGISMREGNLKIGKDMIISTDLTVKSKEDKTSTQYGLDIKNVTASIDDGLTIKNNSKNVNYSEGLRSSGNGDITIKDDLDINMIAENIKYVNSIENKQNSKLKIGNNAKLSIDVKNAEQAYNLTNTSTKEMTIGNNLIVNGKTDGKGFSTNIYNFKDLKIGNDANLTSEGMTVNVYNRQGNMTFGKNATIKTDTNIGIINTAQLTFEDGAKIFSNGYAIQNSNGNLEFKKTTKIEGNIYTAAGGQINATDENSTKIINGGITSKGRGTEVNINFPTSDSIYLGGVLAKEDSKINLNFDKKAQMKSQIENIDTAQVNISLKNDSKWTLIGGNSICNNLIINKSTIDTTQFKNPLTLTANNVVSKNKGEILLKFTPTAINSDFLNFKGGTGKFEIYTDKNSIANLDEHDFETTPIWFADVKNDISFTPKTVDDLNHVYTYQLKLDKDKISTDVNANGKNWYLVGIDKNDGQPDPTDPTDPDKEISTATESIIKNHLFLFRSAYALTEMDTLHKRMSHIRTGDEKHGTWFRTLTGKVTSNELGSDFRDSYYGIQAAYDYKKNNHLTGIVFNRKEDKTKNKNSNLDSINYGLGVYRSYDLKHDYYLDFIAKHLRIDNTFNVSKDGKEMKATYKTWGQILSMESGKYIYDKSHEYFIVPQAQLQYNFLRGAKYTTSTGIRVKEKDSFSLLGRTGFYAGKNFKKSSHYLKTSLLHEFHGKQNIIISANDGQEELTRKNSDTWLEIGISGEFNIKNDESIKIYYSLDKSFFGNFENE